MNDVYRALSDPTRRRILSLLRERDMTAGELAAHFDQSWPTISGHCAVLKDADLVQTDRNGTTITYHLNVSVLEEALRALLDAFRLNVDGAPNESATAADPDGHRVGDRGRRVGLDADARRP